ncbi:MAG: methylated-DNA--[protein]-cysteine S-methyltransferase [Rhizobiales bacterium]|nr:methylated-DNA--[protein]-cysteine S-methyltransferase [Hyphomicrobiales bacterium]
MQRCHLVDTSFGAVGIAWTEKGLSRLLLPQRDRDAVRRKLAAQGAATAEPEGAMAELCGRIAHYFAGGTVEFNDVAVDLGDADRFRLAIYAAARRLRFGMTATYGELAKMAGHEGLARETGAALGRNPVPLVVPCHRILAAGGRIGGFSAPGGAETKKRMLALEGVVVDPPPAQAAFAF